VVLPETELGKYIEMLPPGRMLSDEPEFEGDTYKELRGKGGDVRKQVRDSTVC
jgi:hypothetical protein